MEIIKKKLFIGSSSEELTLAEAVKELLKNDFDVSIWNDTIWDTAVFRINQNFLNDLLKASLKFDFGILLGTGDDAVTSRKETILQPRDNILFELGLFIGRLGISRCAFLVENEIKVLSDFKGITLTTFDKNTPASFVKAVNQIKECFIASPDDEINFFPSVTLASVYFENFIVPICRYVIENKGFPTEQRHYTSCIVNVIVPDKISTDVNVQFEKLKLKFNTKSESFKYAGRPRTINVDTQIMDDKLEFIDFPTIISGINHALINLLPQETLSQNSDYHSILERELRRFVTTLKKLLIKNGFDEIVIVKRESNF